MTDHLIEPTAMSITGRDITEDFEEEYGRRRLPCNSRGEPLNTSLVRTDGERAVRVDRSVMSYGACSDSYFYNEHVQSRSNPAAAIIPRAQPEEPNLVQNMWCSDPDRG